MRDERDCERILGELGDGERHAVDRHRPLRDAVPQDFGWCLDEDAQALAFRLDRLDDADGVDMALDVVPAQLLAGPQRRLDVDPGLRREAAESRAADRLGNGMRST